MNKAFNILNGGIKSGEMLALGVTKVDLELYKSQFQLSIAQNILLEGKTIGVLSLEQSNIIKEKENMTLLEKLLAAIPQSTLDNNSEEVYTDWSISGSRWNSEEDPEVTREDFSSQYLIFFQEYTYEDYSGSGYVFGYDKEKLQFFECFGSHCSCYGLENQFDAELCTEEELIELYDRRSNNSYGEKKKSFSEFMKSLGVDYGN